MSRRTALMSTVLNRDFIFYLLLWISPKKTLMPFQVHPWLNKHSLLKIRPPILEKVVQKQPTKQQHTYTHLVCCCCVGWGWLILDCWPNRALHCSRPAKSMDGAVRHGHLGTDHMSICEHSIGYRAAIITKSYPVARTEVNPKTGDVAVRQGCALWNSLTAPTASLVVMI